MRRRPAEADYRPMRTLQQITAVGVVLAGLVFLYHALADAVPLVFFGTPEEFAAREVGRRLVIVAVLALVATGAALALARRRLSGTLARRRGSRPQRSPTGSRRRPTSGSPSWHSGSPRRRRCSRAPKRACRRGYTVRRAGL